MTDEPSGIGSRPLRDVRVVDRTRGIAGAYCGKLLVDGGADVIRVASDGSGDPFGAAESEALAEFLHAGKRLVNTEHAGEASADILLVDEATKAAAPGQIVVAISPFGLTGPWAGRPATELTLQAAAGSIGFRGLPDEPPMAAGGRLGEWMTGVYAAVGATAALLRRTRTGEGEQIDVSLLDCMAATMTTLQPVFASFYGWAPMTGTGRTVEIPSIEPTADGYVVFTTNSAQQFSDFCVLIGHPELLEDRKLARPNVRFERRDEFEAVVHDYTTERTTAEVLEQAELFRVPAGPVLNGETVTTCDHFVERGVFVRSESGRFLQPRIPYRVSGEPSAPRRGSDASVDAGSLPLAGVRVVDCTAWWAGPSATEALACLGADVIKVESISRPDLMRYASTKPPSVDQWWEYGPMFHTANAGKRGITLDLTRTEGVEVFERLIGTADVLAENYTPRVMEQFGLDWTRVHEINPDLVMVRMPAFGLDGPWRDRTGFAQTMECVAGMAWLTGWADGPPVLVRGACDPLAGMHAVVATLFALLDRDARGGGRLVEATMVEAALNAAAEQVLRYSASGTVLHRDGNRWSGAAPQGVYRCAGEDAWVAIAVADDDQWRALCRVLGNEKWANDVGLATRDGRQNAHDQLDDGVQSWTMTRVPDAVADELSAAGVPAAAVISARDVVRNPQIVHRGLFETEHHPVSGDNGLPTLPFRFSAVDAWLPGPAPTIGQHNDDVFADIGLDTEDIAALRDAGVVGERPSGL